MMNGQFGRDKGRIASELGVRQPQHHRPVQGNRVNG